MDVSYFYDKKLEKKMLEIIKFFIEFYNNNISSYQRKIIGYYKGWSTINYFLLDLDKSLELIKNYTDKKSEILENILKKNYRYIYQINELDNMFRLVPAYNKKIVTYRGINICGSYTIENKLKNMVYALERSNIGKEFMFSIFLSTSIDPYIAIYNFLSPRPAKYDKPNNKYVNKLETTCDDLFELFGKKYFLLMKINIPKGNKFLYLEALGYIENSKKSVHIWENEILLPRNSILKLVKRYDMYMQMPKPSTYSVDNILHNKVKHENIPTRVYEFDYVGYEDNNKKIEFDVFLGFNQNKTYLKEIEKQVEDEFINSKKPENQNNKTKNEAKNEVKNEISKNKAKNEAKNKTKKQISKKNKTS
jgi:hypothetical protein